MTADRGFPWFEGCRVAVGSGCFWQIGPLRIWARRDRREWEVAIDRGDDSLSQSREFRRTTEGETAEDAIVTRFGFKDSPAEIRVAPALADRPIVVTPEEPFLLPAKEEATLFVSTPIWVRVEVGEVPVELLDEPSFRPSDTWFGDSTRVGRLCYATRTRASNDMTELPRCAHRAVSVVHIRNLASNVLEVERFKIPVSNMSLFRSVEGDLWTDELTLVRELEDEVASVVFKPGAPTLAAEAELLVGPRNTLDKGVLDRAFGGLIRGLRG